MGHAAAITNNVKAFMAALQILVYIYFHVVEFDLHAVQQGIVIGSTRRDLIQGVDHFNNAVQNTFRQHQA